MENPIEKISSKKSNLINFLLVFFILLILILFVLFIFYRNMTAKYYNIGSDKEFVINEGENLSEISNNLKNGGFIISPTIFRIYLKLNNFDKNIQAGRFVIPKEISIQKLAMILQHGEDDITIKFIEGWRVEQLAEYLEDNLSKISYRDFVQQAKKYEGILFPDTYFFNKEVESKQVIDALRENFDIRTSDLLTPENLKRLSLSKEQVIVLSSIVEREAAKMEDRKIIAGILLKRYQEGIKLDADATTQYAVALVRFCKNDPSADCISGENREVLEGIVWWPHDLTKEELDYDSPYNTRRNVGLPPAPISSFGRDALESVINYTPTDYYFYLTDSDGVTHYARNITEHEQNIAKYLK